jgi:colanic acid/amylovoran biosynthesis glycosyltransferase
MTGIAYLANSFPEPGESYVWEEIRELRKSGRKVVACSFRRPQEIIPDLRVLADETRYIPFMDLRCWVRACALLQSNRLGDLIWRIIRGPEPLLKKARALAHTFLGSCLAANLAREEIGHIHAHHGYFASWAGMVAARLLGATFSMTLHGSDLLLRRDYLDCKLQNCDFCITVSDFNRRHILRVYPSVPCAKIHVHRLGVDPAFWRREYTPKPAGQLSILSVGRLHPVKGHEFLVRACRELRQLGINFECVIAGEGPERKRLQKLIRELHLEMKIKLRGHVPRKGLPELYRKADVLALTSHSEGIPLAVMEAMASGTVALAPEITGIPELIADGVNGFLYQPGSMASFVSKLMEIREQSTALEKVRCAARRQIEANFHRDQNLSKFAADFLRLVDGSPKIMEIADAHSLLQQI